MYEHHHQKKLSARVRKSHRRAQNTLQCNINNLAKTSKIIEHILDTIITRIAGLPAMWNYKDIGLSQLKLIHIYIYFNILFSYLNPAHSAVSVSRMIRCEWLWKG